MIYLEDVHSHIISMEETLRHQKSTLDESLELFLGRIDATLARNGFYRDGLIKKVSAHSFLLLGSLHSLTYSAS